jgi:hypothetical protein
MSTLVIVYLTDGRLLNGISYRVDPSAPGLATTGPSFSFETDRGWVTVPMSSVDHIDTQAGRPT